LIKIVRGESINRIATAKSSKEYMSQRSKALMKFFIATAFSTLTWTSVLTTAGLFLLVYWSSHIAGNNVHLVYTAFAFLTTTYMLNVIFKVDNMNTKLESLIALLSKSNIIKE
jgi:hypothetical protein